MKYSSFGMALALAAGVASAMASGGPRAAQAQGGEAAQPRQAQTQETQEKPKDQPKTGAPSTQEKTGQSITVTGQVTSADGGVLTVTDAQKAEHKVAVTDQTKVTKGGKEATAADLKMSDKVTVRATKGGDGTLTATSIDISGE